MPIDMKGFNAVRFMLTISVRGFHLADSKVVYSYKFTTVITGIASYFFAHGRMVFKYQILEAVIQATERSRPPMRLSAA
jgi:hypothetical protein